MREGFEEVEHTADVAICVWGGDLAELFANAAYGLACQLAELDDVSLEFEHQIALEEPDVETLLVSWLGELLYLSERDKAVFTTFDIHTLEPTCLEATVRGGPMCEGRRAIKAVTFSELEIVETERGYETTVVFDV